MPTSRPFLVPALLALCASLAACAGLPRVLEGARGDEPAPVHVRRDLPFADRDGVVLRADVYRARPGRLPGAVVLHPGGWFSGDKRDVADLARRLAVAGYVVVAPSYRLAPGHRFPAQIHDVKEAVRWMRARADRLGLEPDRIAAVGYSAGGHLAALLATTGPGDGLEGPTAHPGVSSRVQALVAGGAPTDLGQMRPSPALVSLLGGSAAERPALAASASPMSFVTADDPPAFLYHGRLDFLVSRRHPRRLLDALEAVGVRGRLELSRLGHFTTWLFGGGQIERAVAFLAQEMRAPEGRVARRPS